MDMISTHSHNAYPRLFLGLKGNEYPSQSTPNDKNLQSGYDWQRGKVREGPYDDDDGV
ncbi:hypothetical protein MTR_1g061000 [Medicago truncatula]|uniref:Uncharacterized protein n=1 Tax=Medicago truncatula TaxID=3880 RepID=A0A072VJ72_MEDTR|nr:hypothetical protein MTR_1g061000 [Medicago truncatula]